MKEITIAWLALPFFMGFTIYLLPQLDRLLALGIGLISSIYAGLIFLQPSPLNIQLLDNFGVSLTIDQLSGFFILTNALVTVAVIIYCWQTGKSAFFYMQTIILHGSVNATFICADFISLYVALEVISIAAFLLITYTRTDRSIWIGLRYLFVSNVAMLFYLVGAVLVYQAHHSFNYAGLQGSPPEAIALIFLGLLIKGGIFISGLWLPVTYAESDTPVSAILSGIVGKAALFPLLRCTLLVNEIAPLVKLLGIATAVLGVFWAIFEADTKRTLAFSSISQFGFVLAAPIVGGFYALTHGLVKSALFLIAGVLPSRDFRQLQQQAIDIKIFIPLVIASLSISGFPLLSGFAAKVLTSKNLLSWQDIIMNIVTVGTAITFAKFIFSLHGIYRWHQEPIMKSDGEIARLEDTEMSMQIVQPGFWWAMVILLGGLVGGNIFYYQAYTLDNTIKSLVTIAIGWLAYLLLFKKLFLKLPKASEEFDHLIGSMSLVLILVFCIVSNLQSMTVIK